MPFYLTTWNAQGAVISDEAKKQILISLLKKYNKYPHVFAIQEVGANERDETTINGIEYKFILKKAYFAQNDRCTTGILIPKKEMGNYSAFILDVPDSPRPMVVVRVQNDGLAVASFHAAASRNAVENVTKAIEELQRGKVPWILAGDMNSPPESRDGTYLYCSGESTHRKGNEYDYFYSSEYGRLDVLGVESGFPSDHNAVTALVKW
jgi:endonuclease/exonuclease/phosphatase family metal-dependent hydrolase